MGILLHVATAPPLPPAVMSVAVAARPLPASIVRLTCIDMLRAVASQLLVWHHLAFYGPLADVAYPLAPVLLDWLVDPARFVVQIFLVIGGFGTAQHLLRYEPLTAGIWYLAIDFQLFVLTLAVAMLTRRGTQVNGVSRPGRALVLTQSLPAVPAVLSLFWFNRDPSFDCWGFYYLGSYFLGMLVHWFLSGVLSGPALCGYLGLAIAAVAVDWRPRLLVAVATAVVILGLAQGERLRAWPASRVIGTLGTDYLGRISFSLFLIHFPVCLMVSGWLSHWPLTPLQALDGMVAAWGATLLLAIVFHHVVEQPCCWRRGANGATAGSIVPPTAIVLAPADG